jgi:transposase
VRPPKPQSLRKKGGRKPGGQDGHEGRTLAQVTDVERRQVLDMPPAPAPARSQRIAAPV